MFIPARSGRRCEVVETCLIWATEFGRDAGVWGGDCPMTSGVPSNAAMPVPVVPTQRHSFFDDLLGLIDSG